MEERIYYSTDDVQRAHERKGGHWFEPGAKRRDRNMQPIVGGFVFLAYYWTGFSGDPSAVLEICDSRRTANAVIRAHKRDRDPTGEYGHRANWWVKRKAVCTANNSLTLEGERSEPE